MYAKRRIQNAGQLYLGSLPLSLSGSVQDPLKGLYGISVGGHSWVVMNQIKMVAERSLSGCCIERPPPCRTLSMVIHKRWLCILPFFFPVYLSGSTATIYLSLFFFFNHGLSSIHPSVFNSAEIQVEKATRKGPDWRPTVTHTLRVKWRERHATD